jgi:hypothetical protein
MSIERKPSGFHEWDAEPRLKRPHCIGIDSKRVADCLARYNACGARGLFGHPSFGFAQDNLDFLALANPKPSWLWFWDVDLRDVSGIYALEELDYFGINPQRPGIDFSRFDRLDMVINHWIKADTGLEAASIRAYHLWYFKPRSKSFAEAAIPRSVEQLSFTWANPLSLEGLPVLPRLTRLEIHRCRNLADLAELPRIAPNLQHFLATTAKKLIPTAGIVDHPRLKTARIDGKEIL